MHGLHHAREEGSQAVIQELFEVLHRHLIIHVQPELLLHLRHTHRNAGKWRGEGERKREKGQIAQVRIVEDSRQHAKRRYTEGARAPR